MVQTYNSSSNNNNNNNNISIGVDKRADTTAQGPTASTITQVQHKFTKKTQKTQEKSSKFNNNNKK
jgi:hypothetical protein